MKPPAKFSDDIWVLIFLTLDTSSIRQCQAVCKHLYNLIASVASLRFRLELDAAGYVEPSNPRQGLTIDQRLSVLREHMSRRQSLIPSRVDIIWDATVMEPGLPMFAGGVLAHWARAPKGYGGPYGRLDITRLASPNKGIGMSQWSLYVAADLNFGAVWIHPDWDLLVVAQKTGWGAYGAHRDMEQGFYFHFRTLSENAPHPHACQRTLHLGTRIANEQVSAQFSGRLMLVWLRADRRVVVWEWPTGTVLLDQNCSSSRVFHLNQFLLLDQLLFIVRPHSQYIIADSWARLGTLDVYSLCGGNEPQLIQVASMALPEVKHTSREYHYSNNRVNAYFATELGFTSASDSSACIPGVFEVPDSTRIIQLALHAEDYGSNERYRPSSYALLIPISAVLRAITHSPAMKGITESNIVTIPWGQWGSESQWIRCCPAATRGRKREVFITGPRGVVINWHSCQEECSCPDDGWPQSQFAVSVIELRAGFDTYTDCQYREKGADLGVNGLWVRKPLPNLATGDLGQLGHRTEYEIKDNPMLHAKYTMADFKHELLNEPIKSINRYVWMSDEHIIVIRKEWDFLTDGRVKSIIIFTF